MERSEIRHIPVLLKEVMAYLNVRPGQTVVDGTLGFGGHAKEILKALGQHGRLIGIDQDEEALGYAKENLKEFAAQCIFVRENFASLTKVLKKHGIDNVDGILLDIGISSLHIDKAERGFSFRSDAPLDMRMNKEADVSAYDVVNTYSEEKLADLLRNFGEERHARKIAQRIVQERRKQTIETTRQLSEIVLKAAGQQGRLQSLHPATRTFQAIRIAVNDELGVLQQVLEQSLEVLNSKGRMIVVCFHSLEDRIVKTFFQDCQKRRSVNILTKKPISPTEDEVKLNPRSRSARLRAVERI